MDTCWFAVDKDGHVAVFDTGEAGAVPHRAYIEDAYAVREALVQLIPRTAALQDPDGRTLPGQVERTDGGGPDHQWYGIRDRELTHLLVFLDSLDPVQGELARGRAVQLPSRRGVAVYFASVPGALLGRLHDAGQCRGCYFHYRPDPASGEENEERSADHGLFEYGHLCENWIAGPYGREEVPVNPVHVDQLPPRLREAVRAMTFPNLSFAETPHIQPIEHVPCTAWDSESYRTVDGQTLPMPQGAEDDDGADNEVSV
jgi:hypothetical protein